MKTRSAVAVAALLVAMSLAALVQTGPVFAGTWDPALGWDFECHSDTHPSFFDLTETQIRAELDRVNTAFTAHGYARPQHHAYPYGDNDAPVEKIVSQYRKTGRMVWGEMMRYPVSNWYEMKAAQLTKSTSWSTIRAYVDRCITSRALLQIFTHDVSSNPSEWGCTPTILVQLLDYLIQKQNAGQLLVMTMAQAYDYWTGTTTPKATVIIGFDDANESDYTVVYPLFRARGLKGTSYITTSFIGDPGSLTWDEIAKMRGSQSVFQNGFEAGSFSGWSGMSVSYGETASVTGSRWHHGGYCARFTSNSGGGTEYAYAYKTVSYSSELYARGYFYVSQSGIVENDDRFYMIIFSAGGNNVAYAGWRKIGGVTRWCLIIKNGSSNVITYSTTSPSLNRWYCVELHWKKDSTAGMGELWIDNLRVCSATNKNTAAYGNMNQVYFGLPAIYYCSATTVYCDCAKMAKTYVGPE